MPGQQAQPQQAAPVVAHHGHVTQVEAVENGFAEPVDVTLIGVRETVGGLVRFAEANEVGGHAAMSGRE